MATALIDKIWDHYLLCLQGVSRAAGASCDLIVEEPEAAEGNRDRQYLAILETGDEPEEDDGPQLLKQWLHAFRVKVSVYASESVEPSDLRQMGRSVACDIEKALTGNDNYQDSTIGLIDTTATGSTVSIDSAETHKAEVVCNFTANYRHAWSDGTALS